MRWTWPWALLLMSLVGCKSQGSCLYTTASPYFPGAPGSERLSAKVFSPDGQELSTNTLFAIDGGPRTLTGNIAGSVVECSAGEVVVDTCDPSTGCPPTLYRLAVTAPGLSLGIPVGRAVAATWFFNWFGWGTSQRVAIVDGGDAGTTDGAHPIWLWADDPSSDGEVAGLFRVERQRLFCNPSTGDTHDDYAFRFSAVSGGAEVTLATAQTGTLLVTTTLGQQQHLTVHDLRSYQTAKKDDYWNWAWWASGSAGPTGDPE